MSRIRRGRFYTAGHSQPMPWQVYPHPAMPEKPDKVDSTGTIAKSLLTFQSHLLASEFRNLGNQQLLAILGSEESFSIWSVVGIEKIATGEELVTLKARQSVDKSAPFRWRKLVPDWHGCSVGMGICKVIEQRY